MPVCYVYYAPFFEFTAHIRLENMSNILSSLLCILGIMKELNNKKQKWSVTHKGGWPLSILYIRLQGIKQFF